MAGRNLIGVTVNFRAFVGAKPLRLQISPDARVEELLSEARQVAGDAAPCGLYDPRQKQWLAANATLAACGYVPNDQLELDYIKRQRPQQLRLASGAIKTIVIDESQPAQAVVNSVCKLLGIDSPQSFAFRVERRRNSGTEEFGPMLAADRALNAQGISENDVLILVEREIPQGVTAASPAVIFQGFRKAVVELLEGNPPVTLSEAIQLGALQKRASADSATLGVSQMVPQEFLNVPDIAARIETAEHALPSTLTPLQAMRSYLLFLQERPTTNHRFFSAQERVQAKGTTSRREILLGVSALSVAVLDAITKSKLKYWPLTSLEGWTMSGQTITLTFAGSSDYSVVSTEVDSIVKILSEYTDRGHAATAEESANGDDKAGEPQPEDGASDALQRFEDDYHQQRRAVLDAGLALALPVQASAQSVGSLDDDAAQSLTAARVAAHDHVAAYLTAVASVVRTLGPLQQASKTQQLAAVMPAIDDIADQFEIIAVSYIDLAINIRTLVAILQRSGFGDLSKNDGDLLVQTQMISSDLLEFLAAGKEAIEGNFKRTAFVNLARSISGKSARLLAQMTEVVDIAVPDPAVDTRRKRAKDSGSPLAPAPPPIDTGRNDSANGRAIAASAPQTPAIVVSTPITTAPATPATETPDSVPQPRPPPINTSATVSAAVKARRRWTFGADAVPPPSVEQLAQMEDESAPPTPSSIVSLPGVAPSTPYAGNSTPYASGTPTRSELPRIDTNKRHVPSASSAGGFRDLFSPKRTHAPSESIDTTRQSKILNSIGKRAKSIKNRTTTMLSSASGHSRSVSTQPSAIPSRPSFPSAHDTRSSASIPSVAEESEHSKSNSNDSDSNKSAHRSSSQPALMSFPMKRSSSAPLIEAATLTAAHEAATKSAGEVRTTKEKDKAARDHKLTSIEPPAGFASPDQADAAYAASVSAAAQSSINDRKSFRRSLSTLMTALEMVKQQQEEGLHEGDESDRGSEDSRPAASALERKESGVSVIERGSESPIETQPLKGGIRPRFETSPAQNSSSTSNIALAAASLKSMPPTSLIATNGAVDRTTTTKLHRSGTMPSRHAAPAKEALAHKEPSMTHSASSIISNNGGANLRKFAEMRQPPPAVTVEERSDELQICEDAIDAIDDVINDLDARLDALPSEPPGSEMQFTDYAEAISTVANIVGDDVSNVVANATTDQQMLAIAASKSVSTVNILKETVLSAASALPTMAAREHLLLSVRAISEKLQSHIYLAMRASEAQIRHGGKLILNVRIPSKELEHVSTFVIPAELSLNDFLQMIIEKHKLPRQEYSLRLNDGKTELPLTYSVSHIGVSAMVLSNKQDKSASDAALTMLGIRKKKPLQDVINEARELHPMQYHTPPGFLPDKNRVQRVVDSGTEIAEVITELQQMVARHSANEQIPESTPTTTPQMQGTPSSSSTLTPTMSVGTPTPSIKDADSPVSGTPSVSIPVRVRRGRRASTKAPDDEISTATALFSQQLTKRAAMSDSTKDTEVVALQSALVECRSLAETVAAQQVAAQRALAQYQKEAAPQLNVYLNERSDNVNLLVAFTKPTELILTEHDEEQYRRTLKRCRQMLEDEKAIPANGSASTSSLVSATTPRRKRAAEWKSDIPTVSLTLAQESSQQLSLSNAPTPIGSPAPSVMSRRSKSFNIDVKVPASAVPSPSVIASPSTLALPVEPLSQLSSSLRSGLRLVDSLLLVRMRHSCHYLNELRGRADSIAALGTALARNYFGLLLDPLKPRSSSLESVGRTGSSNKLRSLGESGRTYKSTESLHAMELPSVLVKVQESLPGLRLRLSLAWEHKRLRMLDATCAALLRNESEVRDRLKEVTSMVNSEASGDLLDALQEVRRLVDQQIFARQALVLEALLLDDPGRVMLRDYRRAKVSLFFDYVRAHVINHLTVYEALSTGTLTRLWPLLVNMPSTAAVLGEVAFGSLFFASDAGQSSDTLPAFLPVSSMAGLPSHVNGALESALEQLLSSRDIRKKASKGAHLTERLAAFEALGSGGPTSKLSPTFAGGDYSSACMHGSGAGLQLLARALAAAVTFRLQGLVHVTGTKQLSQLARLTTALSMEILFNEVKSSDTSMQLIVPTAANCSLPTVVDRMLLSTLSAPWWLARADVQLMPDTVVLTDLVASGNAMDQSNPVQDGPNTTPECGPFSAVAMLRQTAVETSEGMRYTPRQKPTASLLVNFSAAPTVAAATPSLFITSPANAGLGQLATVAHHSDAPGQDEFGEAHYNVRRGLRSELRYIGDTSSSPVYYDASSRYHSARFRLSSASIALSKEEREAEALAFVNQSIAFMERQYLTPGDLFSNVSD